MMTDEELEMIKDFIDNYAWHNRECAAIDVDGEWKIGNPACTCGYDEAIAELDLEN